MTGAQICAIDINKESLKEAEDRATRYGVAKNITFEQEDATAMPYNRQSFDIVFCGNVTSLITNKEIAIKEYCRVLKEGGLLAAIPMYYVRRPSENLVRRVSNAIQVQIKPLDKQYWTDFFAVPPLRPYFSEEYNFDNISPEKVVDFTRSILSRDHLKCLNSETRTELEKRYTSYMHLFRENLAHMGYSILLMRNESTPMDPELFTSSRSGEKFHD